MFAAFAAVGVGCWRHLRLGQIAVGWHKHLSYWIDKEMIIKVDNCKRVADQMQNLAVVGLCSYLCCWQINSAVDLLGRLCQVWCFCYRHSCLHRPTICVCIHQRLWEMHLRVLSQWRYRWCQVDSWLLSSLHLWLTSGFSKHTLKFHSAR